MEDCEHINLGKWSKEIDLDQYQIACFINSFDVSFKNGDDHHLKRIEVSCDLAEDKLVQEDDSIVAKVNLKSFLTDGGKNHYDVPHNIVTGYVVAFKNDSQK